MLSQPQPVEYQTLVVGAAPLLKRLLDHLGVAQAIDQALRYQPDIPTTYGTLAQVIIVNRMTFQPQPLYTLAEWAALHGIDRLFDIQAVWLDDDRLGALLDGLAKHQVTIWSTLLTTAVERCQLDVEWLLPTPPVSTLKAPTSRVTSPRTGASASRACSKATTKMASATKSSSCSA
jgi:hypothetical protein